MDEFDAVWIFSNVAIDADDVDLESAISGFEVTSRLDTGCRGDGCSDRFRSCLRSDWSDIFRALPTLGISSRIFEFWDITGSFFLGVSGAVKTFLTSGVGSGFITSWTFASVFDGSYRTGTLDSFISGGDIGVLDVTDV